MLAGGGGGASRIGAVFALLGGISLITTGIGGTLYVGFLALVYAAFGEVGSALLWGALALGFGVGGVALGSWLVMAAIADLSGSGGDAPPARLAEADRGVVREETSRPLGLAFAF